MEILWEGVNEFRAQLERMGIDAMAEARAAVVEAAGEVEKQAKQNASGRPGPNVVTGTLRRSITMGVVTPWGVRGWATRVGPTVIYGRRIELGFTGTDSRGRSYNQPAYPYFRPAMQTVAPRIAEIYQRHMRAALAGH